MSKAFLLTKSHLITVALCVLSCALTGCIESTFTLAKESKLPRSIVLPHGFARTDVSVTLNFYAPLRGPDAAFVLTDRGGKKLEELKGKSKELTPSIYRIVTQKGITEIIKLKPYRQNDNMEQSGRAVALFYVVDDPAVIKKFLGAPGSAK